MTRHNTQNIKAPTVDDGRGLAKFYVEWIEYQITI